MAGSTNKFNRKSIRLPKHDYTQEGAYYVTLVTHNRKCLFAHVIQGQVHLTLLGVVVDDVWQSIPAHFPHVSLGAFVIMPNHIHGILMIDDPLRVQHTVRQNIEQFGKPVMGSIPTIIRSVKSEATRRVNLIQGTPGEKLWQRNYFEHIIRDEKDHQAIYDYIIANPLHWVDDDEYFIP